MKKGSKMTVAQREKVSRRTKAAMTLERRKKISAANIRRFKNKENVPMYGKHHSLETRKKISMSKTGNDKFEGFYGSLNKKLRSSYEWRKVREKVMIRDNYKCSICDNLLDLHIHHIKSLKECIKDDTINEIFNPSNCIILCKKCHFTLHTLNIKIKNKK